MGSRIAIIDDEQVVLSLIRDALEEPGVEIHTFHRPQEAVEQIPALGIEVILSDIRMPGMTGIELMAALRERSVTAPFIFMTGYASLDSAKEAIRLGASGYINKPFELSELRQTITTVLQATDLQKKSEKEDEARLQTLGKLLFDSSDQQAVIESTLRFSLDHSRADMGSLVIVKGEVAAALTLPKGKNEIFQEEVNPSIARLLVSRMSGHDTEPGAMPEELRSELQNAIAIHVEHKSQFCSWMGERYSILAIPVSVERAAFGVILLGFADDSVRLRRADIALLALTGRQLAITLYNQELLVEAKEAYSRLNDAQDQMIGLERLAERGELSAEVGHEINNFLQVVRGNVELVNLWMKKETYDKLPTAMTKITDAVVSMSRFTSELMGDNDGSSERVELSLAQVLREVVERVTIQRRYRGVSLQIELLEDGRAKIIADKMKLQQLFYNLLNNAADAMSKSTERKLLVKLTESLESQNVAVVIQDTGCGFAPEDLARAFTERFTTKKNGHGFGLLVCKKVIESHDGTFDIQSIQGKGTTMTISFPMQTSKPVEAVLA